MDDELRAIAHRIKNDLQLVSSLLHIEASAAEDESAKAALGAVERRLLAITTSWTQNDPDVLDMQAYVRELARSFDDATALCTPGKLPHATATRIGLVLVELFGTGAVSVKVVVGEEELTIDAERKKGTEGAWLVGTPREIVTSLVRQHKGQIDLVAPDRIIVTMKPMLR